MNKIQLKAVQSITSRVCEDNCSLQPSMVTNYQLEMIGKQLFLSFVARTQDGHFNTSAAYSIGSRGKIREMHRFFYS